MRLSRLDFYMGVAKLAAQRSPCKSRQIGAVVVLDKRIIGVGYNGPPPGFPHCEVCKRAKSGENLDECFAIHAEVNACVEALKAVGRVSLKGADLYCTVQPCIDCLKLIVRCDIKNIVYIAPYKCSPTRDKIIKEMGINEYHYPNTP
jgi:dCMP deaminase